MKNSVDSQPLISVVVPAYNGEKTLVSTLESVLNQTYTHFEIIVVDDGSDNPVEAFLRPFINDSRIRIYRTGRSNANIARNYGIQQCRGEYIAMLDADDLWLENHLQNCLTLLQTSSANGLYGSIFMQFKQTSDNRTDRIRYARELKNGESMIDYLLTTGCGAQTSTLFTTARSMREIRWNPALIDHQDYDFVTRFHKKYGMIAKKEPTVIYSLASGRETHYETCIEFVEENIHDIHPAIYTQYNKNMYVNAVHKKAPQKFISYFQKEATRYKEYLSYRQYLAIRNPQTFLQMLYDKLVFIFYVMRIA